MKVRKYFTSDDYRAVCSIIPVTAVHAVPERRLHREQFRRLLLRPRRAAGSNSSSSQCRISLAGTPDARAASRISIMSLLPEAMCSAWPLIGEAGCTPVPVEDGAVCRAAGARQRRLLSLSKRPKPESGVPLRRPAYKPGCSRSAPHRRKGGLVPVSVFRIHAHPFARCAQRVRIPNSPRRPGLAGNEPSTETVRSSTCKQLAPSSPCRLRPWRPPARVGAPRLPRHLPAWYPWPWASLVPRQRPIPA